MNQKNLVLVLFALVLSTFAQTSFAQSIGIKPELNFYRYNSVSGGGSPTSIVNGNILGTIKWTGLTAIGAIRTGASLRSVTKFTAPGILAGDLIFSTSNGTSLNDRMMITETGLVGIGTNNPLYHLDVVGNTHTSGRFYGRIHFNNDDATNEGPNTYFDEAHFQRKTRSVLLVPAAAGVNDFGGILSLAPGGGANDHQLFFGQDGIWNRREVANAASWSGNWEKLLSTGDINGTPNRIARFLPPNSPSSKLGDSQLFDDGTDVGIGTVTPDAAYLLTVGGDTRIDGKTYVNGRLGVGNTAPAEALDVTGNALLSGNATIGGATTTNSLAVTTNATVNGDATVLQKMSVGTATKSATYSLSVLGGIISDEVRVQLQPWPDYVFEANYYLQPLSDLEKYVQEHKHLPGVASAQEVAEKGLDLGQTQKAQMEKIEELYLHMIDMDKQMKSLKAENEALKTKVGQLEKR